MSRQVLTSLHNAGVKLQLFTDTLKRAFANNPPDEFKNSWIHVCNPERMQVTIKDDPLGLTITQDQQEFPKRVWMRRVVAQMKSGDLIGWGMGMGEFFDQYMERLHYAPSDLFAVVVFYKESADKGYGFVNLAVSFDVYLYNPEAYYKKLRRRMEDKLRKIPNEQLVLYANSLGVKATWNP